MTPFRRRNLHRRPPKPEDDSLLKKAIEVLTKAPTHNKRMPLYEYKCKKCGKVFEKLQRLSAKPVTVHENCGGPWICWFPPRRFSFKGTGWYVTDYAKVSRSKSSSAEDR